MKPSNTSKLVIYQDYSDLCYKLNTAYTSTITNICDFLLCSKRTVTRYILPNVSHVYAKYKVTKDYGGPIVAINDLKDNVYYNYSELMDFIYRNTKFTQQVKVVPLYACIDTKCSDDEYLTSLVDQYREFLSLGYIKAAESALNTLFNACLDTASEAGKKCIQHRIESTVSRSKIIHTPRTISYGIFKNLYRNAISSKSYRLLTYDSLKISIKGDSDELVYRKLFAEGWVKCTISLPDEDGNLSRLVRYIPDPNPIECKAPSRSWSGLNIRVPYNVWHEGIHENRL